MQATQVTTPQKTWVNLPPSDHKTNSYLAVHVLYKLLFLLTMPTTSHVKKILRHLPRVL